MRMSVRGYRILLTAVAAYTSSPFEDKGNPPVVDPGCIEPSLEVEGSEGTKVAFGGSWFDAEHEIRDPVSCRCERGRKGAISESPAQCTVILEDSLVVQLRACREGVAKEEFSLQRKSAGLGSFETCRPTLPRLSWS
jgi:hypothetical protein